jgi:hypothetical protein
MDLRHHKTSKRIAAEVDAGPTRLRFASEKTHRVSEQIAAPLLTNNAAPNSVCVHLWKYEATNSTNVAPL